jgi:hypothetical protein
MGDLSVPHEEVQKCRLLGPTALLVQALSW